MGKRETVAQAKARLLEVAKRYRNCGGVEHGCYNRRRYGVTEAKALASLRDEGKVRIVRRDEGINRGRRGGYHAWVTYLYEVV